MAGKVRISVRRKSDSEVFKIVMPGSAMRIAVLPGVVIINEAEGMSPISPQFTRFVIALEDLFDLSVVDVTDG